MAHIRLAVTRSVLRSTWLKVVRVIRKDLQFFAGITAFAVSIVLGIGSSSAQYLAARADQQQGANLRFKTSEVAEASPWARRIGVKR